MSLSSSRPAIVRRATAAGLAALVAWSLMTGLIRMTTEALGPQLGTALIYTLGAAFLFLANRPTPLRDIPRKYLVVGGALFVVYEVCMANAIGLAADERQTVEVGILNYLWPTFTVLFWAALQPGGRLRSLGRVLPGAVIATAGIVLAVGGRELSEGGMLFSGLLAKPVPYLLALVASVSWAVYSTVTPRMAKGANATAYFFALVAVALWALFGLSGASWPQPAMLSGGAAPLLAATVVVASGYALWNVAINHGDMRLLSSASYAAPVLSSIASALLLAVAPRAALLGRCGLCCCRVASQLARPAEDVTTS